MAGQLELEGIGAADQGPQTNDEWLQKWAQLSMLFSPTAPIEDAELFSGRNAQLRRLIESTFQRGQHAVVHGDRGVGKTSLVNIFQTKIFPTTTSAKFFATKCLSSDTFIQIWERAFGEFEFEDGLLPFDEIDSTLDAHRLLQIVKRFGNKIMPVFIFDEYDRLTDDGSKIHMAETIKLFSDESASATIIIVGVGRTVRDLLDEHESVKRAIRQIEMPRMSDDEIREIVGTRLSRVGMTSDSDVMEIIVRLSRGIPAYAHLLGLHTAQAAVDEKTLHIGRKHVAIGLSASLDDTNEAIRQAYAKATHSSKPNNQFKQVLLACAMADQDEFRTFSAGALRAPLKIIMKEDRDIPSYARHLKAFCDKDRGPILEREGSPTNYRFRFIDPMMQSYVLIVGFVDQIGDVEPVWGGQLD
jgi:Cdc6-like AAA superfamily ATPase